MSRLGGFSPIQNNTVIKLRKKTILHTYGFSPIQNNTVIKLRFGKFVNFESFSPIQNNTVIKQNPLLSFLLMF